MQEKKKATDSATAAPQWTPPPASFELLSSETLVLSREAGIKKAREHASMPQSPTERPKESVRLKHLTEAMRERRFLPCCWATVLYQGVTYRMNGQNSSNAILEMLEVLPEALPEKFVIHLDHYKTDTPDGMGILFRQFDARWPSRTANEVCRAYQGLVPDLRGIDREKVKLGMQGVSWFFRCCEGVPFKRGDDLYANLLNELYQPFLCWMDGLVNDRTPELLYESIIAAMYATFLKSESGAQEFWAIVATPQLVIDDKDPRVMLHRELYEAHQEKKKPLSERKSRGKKSKALAELKGEMFAKCTKAWGAYRTSKEITNLHIDMAKWPFPIAD